MKLLIKNGRVINPADNYSELADVLIENNRIKSIKREIINSEAEIIEAENCIVTPGLVDIHVHFREPGFPEKETIASGSRSAAAGGFTAVVCMPNTSPAIDSKEVLKTVSALAAKDAVIKIYSSAAITKGLHGMAITNLKELHEYGAVTFTDDGKTVMEPSILMEAFRQAAALKVPVSSHCEDHNLVKEGAINRGDISEKMGDPGIPRLGEELIIARDLLMAEEMNARLHIQHVSTGRGVQLIREAKARGVKVTAEASPHHFSIADDVILAIGSLGKVNPPLRTRKDLEAVIAGLQDRTLDVIATDHAPHTSADKELALKHAPFGLVGLETAVGLTFTNLVHKGKIPVEEAIAKMTNIPASVMNLPDGRLEVGKQADITVIDPDKKWQVDASRFKTKSRNTPFDGFRLQGKVICTIYNGKVVYQEGE